MSSVAIVWFRRDLRLADNPALDRARHTHERVLPVYIHDPEAEADWAPGAASRWWLHHALSGLDQRLRKRASRLILARGDSLEELRRMIKVSGAVAVYWNRLYEPSLVERDRVVKRALREDGLEIESENGSLLNEPWELLKGDGSPYKVFTPFWKQVQKHWRVLQPFPEPRQLVLPRRCPATLTTDELDLLPRLDWADGFRDDWQPGEPGGRKRLQRFVEEAVSVYHAQRDHPGTAGTSGLSPHLHFGEVSPRQVVRALDEAGELPAGKGRWSYLREIAWREFSTHLLFHFPHLPEKPLNERFSNFPWRDSGEYADDLAAWQGGRTGIPMVDAGMRELWATGWMHNRVRMVVASFLTKNLLIPWQEGARWFWDTLVDADLANNTQGWQWTAGCGADAAPYFRVFNPVLQGEKFDPEGDYVRRWCPELRHRGQRDIHHPLSAAEARDCGYPEPLVDLRASRQRALDAWDRVRS
jgi:deoxyribodipyrimidine photo-lyase